MLTDICDVAKLLERRAQGGKPYLEFLRVASMSAGLYVLPAGGTDRQIPHREDELYYVIRGRARMRVASEEHAVGEGSTIFVAAEVEHGFFEVEEELVVLVFFSPAENEIG
jgi:mannose-6-phosphate isomerase-like protein (cupin superfamily)